MKTKGNKKNKVNVITLGCAKNLVDSEVLVTQLKGNGIEAVHESIKENSNIVIINTCGFIQDAKQESIDTILRFAEARDSGQIEKLYVTGCLSQRYKEGLEREIPSVDAWFGTSDLPRLLKRFNASYKHELIGERLTSTSHYAYMKIAEGCDRPCSFCAIPLMRGSHRSRPLEELISEADNLVNQGVKELLLIAQDLTYYGLDLYKKRALADLISHLSDVEGLEWIRLHYAFPSGFPMDVLDVMAQRKNVCKYLDIPLQHGSSNMLEIMRRGITREKTESLLHTIREKIPDITLRTTMLTGHPGETEKDFKELMDFVEKQRFERLGVFTYSHEEDTAAYQMEDNIPDNIKQERASAVMELQEEISLELNQAKVGQKLKVLIDRKEGIHFVGRTEFDSPEVDNEVLINAEKYFLRIGDFARIKITEAMPFDLVGIPV